MSNDIAIEIFKAIKERLDMYSHIHKYADKAKQPSDMYFDDNEEPLEMCSVGHALALYPISKDMGSDYEAMNELQDNIESIAKSDLLKEIVDDIKHIARDFGVEI